MGSTGYDMKRSSPTIAGWEDMEPSEHQAPKHKLKDIVDLSDIADLSYFYQYLWYGGDENLQKWNLSNLIFLSLVVHHSPVKSLSFLLRETVINCYSNI